LQFLGAERLKSLNLKSIEMEKSQIIAEIRSAKACSEGISRFEKHRGTIEEYVLQNPKDVLWAYTRCETLRPTIDALSINGQFALDWAAIQDPVYAIYLGKPLNFISTKVLKVIVEQHPKTALSHAAEILPIYLLTQLAHKYPIEALWYASHVLPKQVLRDCVQAAPEAAIEYVILKYTGDILPVETLESYAKVKPAAALEYCVKRLSPQLFEECINSAPVEALIHALDFMSIAQIEKCAKAAPVEALKYAANYLPPSILKYCAEQHPKIALEYARDYLPDLLFEWCKENI